MTTKKSGRWEVFARQSLLDVKLWLFILLIQVVWHLVFLVVVLPDIEFPPTLDELVLASFNAFRFDSKVAAVLTLVSWFLISYHQRY